MLNFRTANIAVVITLAALLIAGASAWAWVAVLLVYSLVLFYGSYYVGSNFFMKVLCSGDGHSRQIALSFDDGPAESYTPEILQMLKQAGVPAAFFCIGKKLEGREALVQQIIAGGHLIGNHSHSHHFWFDFFPAQKMRQDLVEMSDAVRQQTGQWPKLFRPPYGVTTPAMRKAVKQGGFTAIGWSHRSLDTVTRDPEQLFQKLMRGLRPGSIVLLHDTSGTTSKTLLRFIEAARKQGYEFVRVDKLLNVVPYA